MDFKDKALSDLRGYLLAHERDIAWGINDFDHLRTVFREFVGRDARMYESGGITIAT